MKTLVTGILGFVGQFLHEELDREGFEVFGISKDPTDKKDIYVGDILDQKFMSDLLKKIKPDVVFHLAGFTSVKDSWDHPDVAMKVNQGGTRILFKAIEDSSPKTKIILISSAEVYGIPQHVPISENHPLKPITPYGESKLAQEKVATEFPHIKSIVCRSFPHTGPRQAPIFVVPTFAQQISLIEKDKQAELAVGNLEAKRDFSDVRDVVRAYRLFAQSDLWGKTYNVSSGVSHTIKEVLDMLLSLSKKKIRVTVDPARLRPSEIPILWGDNTKIRNELLWTPTTPLQQTLEDSLNYWRSVT